MSTEPIHQADEFDRTDNGLLAYAAAYLDALPIFGDTDADDRHDAAIKLLVKLSGIELLDNSRPCSPVTRPDDDPRVFDVFAAGVRCADERARLHAERLSAARRG
jgi:hypothetical protein